MSRTTRSFSLASACALSLALVGLLSAASQAATINYGNFGPVPPGISFLAVTESSGTDTIPLYGPPVPYTTGLDFDPTNFVATTMNGGADITDGQLNLTVAGGGIHGIGTIALSEAGDYTIQGAGTPATGVNAGLIIRATVTHINNALLPTPINLAPVSASFGDALPPAVIVGPWSLGATMNVGAQLLALGRPAGDAATRVEVVINNSLVATSEANTVAFIAKKEFRLDVIRVPAVPEPSSMALISLALGGLGLAGRKRG